MNTKMMMSLALLALLLPFTSHAHPGRTDASGCHTCRTNCPNWGLSSGEYHCHNAKAAPQPLAPIKSTFGENGTGYTSPAPEYATPKPVVNTYKPIAPAREVLEIKSTSTTKISSYNNHPVTKPIPAPKSWLSRIFSLF